MFACELLNYFVFITMLGYFGKEESSNKYPVKFINIHSKKKSN